MRSSCVRCGLAAAAVVTALAVPAAAQAPYRFKPFAAASFVTALDESEARLGAAVDTVELSDESGFEVGCAWRIGRIVGVEASWGRSEHEVSFGGERLGEVALEPIAVALDLHFGRWERFDPWVAPTLVVARWRDARLLRGVELRRDEATRFGIALGADWRLGERWALTAALRYLDLQLELGDGEVAVDPLTARLGLAAHF
jgi:hypothetical protein